MRTSSLILASIAAVALAACDQSSSTRIAGLGAGTTASGGNSNNGGVTTLSISPNRVQLIVGGTAQLTTNAPFSLQSQVSWASLQSTIALVSPAGLVTAVAPGTATVTARYTFDTTRVAAATIIVTGTTTGSGNTGAP
jgi:uncharacterized protein YjdB